MCRRRVARSLAKIIQVLIFAVFMAGFFSFSKTTAYAGYNYFGGCIQTADCLSADQRIDCKAAYDALSTINADTKQLTIRLPSGHVFSTPDEAGEYSKTVMQTALDAYVRDHPEVFWLSLTDSNWSLSYPMDGSEFSLDSIDYTIREGSNSSSCISSFNAAISSLPIDTSSRYTTVKSIHDCICNGTTYDGGVYSSAYDSLVNGSADCNGYTKAFKALCDRYNIPCIIIVGKVVQSSGTSFHSWNYVQMEDGKWYAVDATWDDPDDVSLRHDFFLSGADSVSSGYGSLDNSTFSQNHLPVLGVFNFDSATFPYPELSSSGYSQSAPDSTGNTGNTSGSDETLEPASASDPASESKVSNSSVPASGSNAPASARPSGNAAEKDAAEDAAADAATEAQNSNRTYFVGRNIPDTGDARAILQYLLHLKELNPLQTLAADVNGDHAISVEDMAIIICGLQKEWQPYHLCLWYNFDKICCAHIYGSNERGRI